MFTPRDIRINPVVCANQQGGGQALSQLSQIVKELFTQLANGVGTVARFKLTTNLPAGASAAAQIRVFEGGGFSNQRAGTVHDEEPGGFWQGDQNDEGWCIGRDGQEGHYSILFMAPVDIDGNVNQSWIEFFQHPDIAGTGQIMQFHHTGINFFPTVSGEEDDVDTLTAISSTVGTHSALEHLTGERWQVEPGTDIITDLEGGPAWVSLWVLGATAATHLGTGDVTLGVQSRATSGSPWQSYLNITFPWSNPVAGSYSYPFRGHDRYPIFSATAGTQYKMVIAANWTGTTPTSFIVSLPSIFFEKM